ncbi:MAG: hypothetical protein CMH63_03515 [Nanoarchaeota archaeon]|jgi:hypothetical protein|nr:hypothetical protein [Nanoarchaeota archaeon]|tara:strand:- start:3965 stop:4222 length:258 start_codon:yes stop_codon:yes gene_type:complete
MSRDYKTGTGENSTGLSDRVYDLLEERSELFLGGELREKFRAKTPKLSKQDIEDFTDLTHYLFGYFSKMTPRGITRMTLHFLHRR